jgi:predicted house-cleaning NTP pyrophosphatase (Maf/HAM1 superfamily)
MIDRKMTVGRCLVRRLEFNLKHVLGFPVLRFLDLIEESDMDLVNTCSRAERGP